MDLLELQGSLLLGLKAIQHKHHKVGGSGPAPILGASPGGPTISLT